MCVRELECVSERAKEREGERERERERERDYSANGLQGLTLLSILKSAS